MLRELPWIASIDLAANVDCHRAPAHVFHNLRYSHPQCSKQCFEESLDADAAEPYTVKALARTLVGD